MITQQELDQALANLVSERDIARRELIRCWCIANDASPTPRNRNRHAMLDAPSKRVYNGLTALVPHTGDST
jgi:hypothetical protein